jgi:hypothetical protein
MLIETKLVKFKYLSTAVTDENFIHKTNKKQIKVDECLLSLILELWSYHLSL